MQWTQKTWVLWKSSMLTYTCCCANRQQPVVGDVVEYPLSDVVRQQLQDGRSHGVGLLVGRNKDRGDAKTLPEEALGLCEIEPLRQEEPDSDR